MSNLAWYESKANPVPNTFEMQNMMHFDPDKPKKPTSVNKTNCMLKCDHKRAEIALMHELENYWDDDDD